jgi:hypothetical protein
VARASTGAELGIRFRCKRYCCPACSLVRKQEWIGRLYLGLNHHRLKQLFYLCWDTRTWGKVRKAIQRAGGKFIKVAVGQRRDRFVVLFTVPLFGAEAIDDTAALDKLAKALREVPLTRGRPVTVTRNWLPPLPRARKWRFAGNIPASKQHFNDAIEAEAKKGHLRATAIAPGVTVWRFCDDVPEAERVRIREHIFGHTLKAEQPKQSAAGMIVSEQAI